MVRKGAHIEGFRGEKALARWLTTGVTIDWQPPAHRYGVDA
jgi:hypothetical protein